jgi:hypothetical protein
VQKANLTGQYNDARRIDDVRPGPAGGIDTGTGGSEYLDAFQSSRSSHIGP